ncbi:MAG: rhomboid family intramembrane serine protease [Candidatus Aenigmarchaeota archaeon]|nr:rhomboid family intramembrane serine protease [Candidatus Aenigmarchaeota archaeon]
MKSTLILIAACIFAFVLQTAVQGFTDAFILDSAAVWSRPWTLLTAVFLHADLLHLGYNMIALFFFGAILESIVGARIFLLLFFIAGLDASFASLFFYEQSLGASGAVYGLIGALAVLRPKLTAFALGVPMPMIVVAGVYLILDILGVFYPTNIANAAHIAGLFVGALAGLLLRRKFPEPKRRKSEKALSDKEIQEWEKEWMKNA